MTHDESYWDDNPKSESYGAAGFDGNQKSIFRNWTSHSEGSCSASNNQAPATATDSKSAYEDEIEYLQGVTTELSDRINDLEEDVDRLKRVIDFMLADI